MIFENAQRVAFMGIEGVINQALRYDPVAQNAISDLEGQVLCVEINQPKLELFVIHTSDGITLMNTYEGKPDVTLSGSALSLINLAVDANDQHSFSGTGVEVKGNNELLRSVRNIMHKLDVDWEAILAELIGDVPAHLLGRTIRSMESWRKQAKPRAADVIAGFTQEEIRLSPSKNESQEFFNEVRLLSKDVDRMSAHINKLENQLNRQQQGG